MARLARIILAALGTARGEGRLVGRDHAHARAILAEGGHQSAVIGLRVFLGCATNTVALDDLGPADGLIRRTPVSGDISPAIGGPEFAIAALKRAFGEIADVHLHRAIVDFDRELAVGRGALKPSQTLNAAQGAQNQRRARDLDLAGFPAL